MSTIDSKVTSRATFNQLQAAESTKQADVAVGQGPATPDDQTTISKDTLLANAAAVGGSTAAQLEQRMTELAMGDSIDQTEMDALFDAALGEGPAAPPPERFALPDGQVLKNGVTDAALGGDTVTQLQTALGELKDPSGKPYFQFDGETIDGPTGNYLGVTEAAVKQFQQDHGLTPDGKVGPKTAAALNAALAAKEAVEAPDETVVAPPPPQTLEEEATASGDPAAVEQAIHDAGNDPVKLGRVAELLPAGDPRKEALTAIATGQVTGETARQIVNALQDQQNTRQDFEQAALHSNGDPAAMKALAAVARFKATQNQDQGNATTAAEMNRLAAAFDAIGKASPAVARELALGFDGSGNGGDFERALAAATTREDQAALLAYVNHNVAVESENWFKTFPDPNEPLGRINALNFGP